MPAGWIIEKDDSNEDVFVNSVNSDKVCQLEVFTSFY